MGSDDWENWEVDDWKIHPKFRADDLTHARQLKKSEELTRDDVLGARHHIKGVECKKCQKKWNRGAINVCIECIEYFCDEHIENHGGCTAGR